MQRDPTKGQAPSSSSGEHLPGGSRTPPCVMVIEGAAPLRTELCRFLERAGCRTLPAATMEEAQELVSRTPLDVIIADISLQGAFGLDMLSLAERHCPTAAVILTTQYPQLEDAARAMRQGAFDYLVKPVEKGQMLRKVDAGLRHKNLLDRQNRLETENAKYRGHLEELVKERTRELEKANRLLSEEIAERDRAEQALLNQSMFLETLMASIPTPMFYKDTEGMYLGCNPAFSEFMGLDRWQIIGRSVFECWPRKYAEIYQQRDDELLEQGGQQEYEGPVRLPNGEERHVIFKKAVFPKNDGEAGGIIGLIVDTTRSKRLENALREATRQAQTASLAKSEFLASMSHEIRTPMTAILGMADLLWNSRLGSDQKRHVEIIRSAGENLLELINDILDLSRVESGRLQLEDIPFCPRELAEKACDVIAHRSREKGLELTWRVEPELPPHIMGDPGRLNQVLVNLLGNAVKFTEHGEVALSMELQDKPPMPLLHIQVMDTGVGIAPEDQEAIFERFTQADTSTTRRFGGTGLGLSICKSLLERMQGEIWVESERGAGSVFHVCLPLKVASCAVPTLAPHAGCEAGGTAIVAAAGKNLFMATRSLLQEQGWVSRNCSTPEKLLQLLDDPVEVAEASVIYLDEGLAGGHGRTLPPELVARLASLTETEASAPVILLLCAGAHAPASWCSHQDSAGGRRPFWHGVLQKPIRRNELRDALAVLSGAGDVTQHKENPAPDRHQDLGPLQILLVEDAASTQILVGEYLKHTPHVLRFATNGLDGVERYKARHFDLVLMDLDMPVMDGFQALQEIRRFERDNGRPAAVVVACSAKALAEDKQASLQAGFDSHLSKPMRRKELLDAIRSAAGQLDRDQGPVSSGLTFLVADDSDVMRIIVGKVLKELGQTRILEAGNGQEALALFNEHKVDCIICDWNMPRMKGIDLLHEVRSLQESGHIPFIMLTAEHLDDYVNRAVSEGITRYVTKPFRLEQLKEVVVSVLPELQG